MSNVILIASPLNGATIEYYKDNQKILDNLFTINKTTSRQTIPVNIIDKSRDSNTIRTVSTTCIIPAINDIRSQNSASIILNKEPNVIVDKGGKCVVSWDIENMPNDTSCDVVSIGENILTPTNPIINLDPINGSNSGFVSVDNLKTNHKITVNCRGPGVNLSSSTICRISPEISEI